MEVFLQQVGLNLDYTRELLIVALILGRTMPMIYLTPYFAGQLAPPEIKMGLGVLFTIIVWPTAREAISADVPYTAGAFFLLMLKEIFIGFSIGFVNGHCFFAMEVAGRIIDTVRGTSMSEVQVPHSKQRSTSTGSLYFQLFLVILISLNGHHIFLDAYFLSFQSMPLNESIGLNAMVPFVDYIVHLTSDILLIGTTLAAPIMAATFITDIVFGILNRVAPQLNAYFMSMPVKALGGVIIILVALYAIADRFEHYTSVAMVQTRDVIHHLSQTKGS